MSERLARALGTLLLAAAIAGCGSSADEDAAKRVVNRWADAVVAHDSAAACATLSARLRASIERHLLGEGVKGSCRTWAARYVSPRHPAAHDDVGVGKVAISGPNAVATLHAPRAEDAKVSLVKKDGAWQIDDY